MNAKINKTIKNWRWWVMMVTWYPIAFPFAFIQFLLSACGSGLVYVGEAIRDFSDWQYTRILRKVFRVKDIQRWVYGK